MNQIKIYTRHHYVSTGLKSRPTFSVEECKIKCDGKTYCRISFEDGERRGDRERWESMSKNDFRLWKTTSSMKNLKALIEKLKLGYKDIDRMMAEDLEEIASSQGE